MPKNYSSDARSKALHLVEDSRSLFETQRQDIRDRWVKNDKAYRAIYDKNKQAYAGDSKYASPILQNNIETVVGRLSEAVRITDKALDISADESKPGYQQNKMKAQAYKQIAIKQSEQQDIEDKKDNLLRMEAKYGTCFAKVPWLKEEDVLKQRVVKQDPVLDELGDPVLDERGQQLMGEPYVEEVENDVITYIGPGYEVITDNEDLYMDMFIQNIQDQPVVVHRMLVDETFLDEQVKDGNYYKDEVERLKKNPLQGTNDTTTGTSRSEEVLGQSRVTDDFDEVIREYEIFEAWATADIEGNGKIEKMVITTADDKLIGIRANPFWHKKNPFLESKYIEVEGEAFGISAIDGVLDLWYDYNDTMNQMNDAAAFVLNPIIIEFIGNAKSKQSLKVQPGAVWSEKVQGALRILQQDLGTILGGEQRLQAMEQRINTGMGITPLMQGASDDLDQTWRGTKTVISQGDKKFKQRAKSFEKNMWKDWLEMGFSMNAQLMDTPFLFVENEQQLQLNMQEVVGEFSFTVSGVDHFFDLAERLEKTMLFSDRSANKPWINNQFLDRQIAEMMNLKDIDQIVIQPPPPPKVPMKPANVSITLNTKDGVGIAMAAAQVMNQNGYEVDVNQILEDANILTDKTAPTALINSGFLPDQLEEDMIENADDEDVDEKVKIVTGVKPK